MAFIRQNIISIITWISTNNQQRIKELISNQERQPLRTIIDITAASHNFGAGIIHHFIHDYAAREAKLGLV